MTIPLDQSGAKAVAYGRGTLIAKSGTRSLKNAASIALCTACSGICVSRPHFSQRVLGRPCRTPSPLYRRWNSILVAVPCIAVPRSRLVTSVPGNRCARHSPNQPAEMSSIVLGKGWVMAGPTPFAFAESAPLIRQVRKSLGRDDHRSGIR